MQTTNKKAQNAKKVKTDSPLPFSLMVFDKTVRTIFFRQTLFFVEATVILTTVIKKNK